MTYTTTIGHFTDRLLRRAIQLASAINHSTMAGDDGFRNWMICSRRILR
ncbi:MAG: hypothetical protein IH903_04115 [Proteobacteria bacterium]|nr:hypothetical protein [Pseudomonadota bacterium]